MSKKGKLSITTTKPGNIYYRFYVRADSELGQFMKKELGKLELRPGEYFKMLLRDRKEKGT